MSKTFQLVFYYFICPFGFVWIFNLSLCTLCLLIFLVIFFTVVLVSKPVYVFSITELRYHFCLVLMPLWCTNPFLSQRNPLHKRASSPQVGCPVSQKRGSSASEPSRFQPASYNLNFIVSSTSIIAELYLKIDFSLNELVSSQPVSHDWALRFCLQNKTLAWIEMASCYANGYSNYSGSSNVISFHKRRSKNKHPGNQEFLKE